MTKQQLQNELEKLDARRAEIVAELERDDGPWVPEDWDTVWGVSLTKPHTTHYDPVYDDWHFRAGMLQPTEQAARRYATWLHRNAQLVTKALEMVGDWMPDMDSNYYTPVRAISDDWVFKWSCLRSTFPKIGEIPFPSKELCEEFCDWANRHKVGL